MRTSRIVFWIVLAAFIFAVPASAEKSPFDYQRTRQAKLVQQINEAKTQGHQKSGRFEKKSPVAAQNQADVLAEAAGVQS